MFKRLFTWKRAGWAVLVLLAFWLVWRAYGYAMCGLGWADTGYKTKYSAFAGCLVQQSTGKWLHEDKVRPE